MRGIRPLRFFIRVISYLLAVIVIAGLLTGQTLAQNVGDLRGQELTLANSITSFGKSVFDDIIRGSNLKGNIGKVTVTEDDERSLVIVVQYSGFAGASIWADALDSGRRAQGLIQGSPVKITGGGSQVELTLTLAEQAPEDPSLISTFLKLNIGDADGRIKVSHTYALHKRWEVRVPPENVIVRITPQPVGAAARLGESETTLPAPEVSPAVAEMSLNKLLKPAGEHKYGVPLKVAENRGRGPSNQTVDLVKELRVAPDVLHNDGYEGISGLMPVKIFEDQNPDSGIFYYLPRAYHVSWDGDQGYGLKLLLSAASQEGQPGEARWSSLMDANVTEADLRLAMDLLRARQAQDARFKFRELRAMPLAAAPKISLTGGLQHFYNVPQDKITAIAFSEALEQVKAAWVTDLTTSESMKLALKEKVGISGEVTFQPAGDGVAQKIPLEIQLAKVATFGDLFWRRGERVANRTPYPVRLKYLHIMLMEGHAPTIYSWRLGEAVVPPQAKVRIDPARIPTWLDRRAKRMWIEYAPLSDCETCDERVIEQITNGVADVATAQITFHTITPLVDTGAYEVTVKVRSKYFDPRSREVKQKDPLALNTDNKDFTLGPIYPVNRRGDDPLFEYSLDVTMPDGSAHKSPRWVPSDSLRVVIGKIQVQELLKPNPEAKKRKSQ